MGQGTRNIVARGLTPNEKGKAVLLSGFFDEPVFLRSVEHMDGGTYATITMTVCVAHDSMVTVYD